MGLLVLSADGPDAPRNAGGPQCLCCARCAAFDLEDDADDWREVTLGGFLTLTVCPYCHDCPLVGPCRYSEVLDAMIAVK